jgi:hypothetical protein
MIDDDLNMALNFCNFFVYTTGHSEKKCAILKIERFQKTLFDAPPYFGTCSNL